MGPSAVSLKGKVVFVTGGETGIGRSIALTCANAGAGVCIAGLSDEHLATTLAEIDALGREPGLSIRADISDASQVDSIIDAVNARWGRLDAAIANAGMSLGRESAHELPLSDWQKVLDVSLTGTFLTVTAAARYLIEQGQGGSILATGSSTAIRVIPGAAAYIAAKGGVQALMNAMALELAAHKIRVNTIIPGPTRTPAMEAMKEHMEAAQASVPLGELVDPDELGQLVAFAISDAVPHMTGSQIKIDSGRTIA